MPSFGKFGRSFATEVQEILKGRYKIDSFIPPEFVHHSWRDVNDKLVDKKLKRSGFHLDNEAYARTTVQSAEEDFKDSLVYVLQPTRVYDERLEISLARMEMTLDNSQERLSNTQFTMFRALFKQIQDSLDTGGEGKYVCIESVPDHNLRKVRIQVELAKRYGADRVCFVTPKTSYEWTHNSEHKYKPLGIEEANTLEQVIRDFRDSGVDSLIGIHFHAPHDVLDLAQRDLEGRTEDGQNKMDVLNLGPQSFTTLNGERVGVEEIFEGLDLNYASTHPFDQILSHSVAEKKNQYSLNRETANSLVSILCVDVGALTATEEVSQHYGIKRIVSEKSRSGEGETERRNVDTLDDHLDNLARMLKAEGKDPTKERFVITLYNMDDKLNSGGTANKEAQARKLEVEKYNQEQGTDFDVEYVLCCTHLRTPDLRAIQHKYVDKIIVSDSVPYNPDVETQLNVWEKTNPKLKGLAEKITILPFSAKMMAAGIALDIYNHDQQYKEKIDCLRNAS